VQIENTMNAAQTSVVTATHIATGETYYLTGFETVRMGHVRACFTSLPAQAKRYSSKTVAAQVAKWSKDTYSSAAFAGFASKVAA
jgi:hypothetical protein